MRARLVGLAAVVCVALIPLSARGDTQVSFDVGAFAAQAPLDGSAVPGMHAQALSMSTVSGVAANMASAGSGAPALGTIVGAEFRPTYSFGPGLRVAIGFRIGESGSVDSLGNSAAGPTATLVGGDVGFGYQRWFGNFLPFAEVRFGVNEYDFNYQNNLPAAHAEQLRLDGVLGGRLYLGKQMYLAASVFAGWGDEYGASLGIGYDIVRYRHVGVLP